MESIYRHEKDYIAGKAEYLDDIKNYMPACRMCNFYKMTYTPEQFRQRLQTMTERLEKQFIYRLAKKYGTVKEQEKKIVFSIPAKEELKVIVAALKETLGITIDSFIKDDIELAGNVEPLEQVIDKLKKEMMERHVDRLQNGKCTIQLGFVFSDLLTNFERVSDHCSNIAVYTLQLKSSKLDSHKFLKKIRNEENGEFAHKFNEYEEKYSL